ncbi:13089_t:CDS:2 [Ambispora gerdemannii]|uniref:13089_t:CDS:1 n=1 Tax=Ambispora gerdemannii TaxID=144530 RepID=A0A9N9A8H5_9GLOM|nr:13089_t:CDS:2 [Ambispora gerdemannii]
MYESNPTLSALPMQSTNEIQNLMYDYFDNEYTAPGTDFDAQIQALFANNGAELIPSSNFTNLQWEYDNESASSPENASIFTPEMFSLSSPESFAQIHSPLSYTTGDDYESMSPPPLNNNLIEFANSNDQLMTDFGYQLFPTKMEFASENVRKRQTIGEGDAIFDEGEHENTKKKQRNSNADQYTKKISLNNNNNPSFLSNTEQLIKDEPVDQTSTNTTTNSYAQNLIMCLADGIATNITGTQNIVVPGSPTISPAQLSSDNYEESTLLAFDQDVWPSTTSATSATHSVSSQPNYVKSLNPTALQNGASLSLPSQDEINTTATIGSTQNTNTSSPATLNNTVTKLPITRLKPPVERRYRNNINDRINDLKNVVPALCHLKTTILRKATEYINYLKKNNQQLKVENDLLKKIVEDLPGGIELYHSYFSTSVKPSIAEPHLNEPSSSLRDTRSRAFMALFMFVTFFTSPSQHGHDHSIGSHQHEPARALGLSSNENIVENAPPTGFFVNGGTLTIDIWYLARMFTFLLCIIYILRPSFLSSHPSRAKDLNQVITSILAAKNKSAKELYRSLSKLISPYPTNSVELFFGFITESLKMLTRWRTFGGSVSQNMESEISLWGRLGEVELCGGNEKVSRLSILYTTLRTVNLLEAANINISSSLCVLSPSRIYANAAIQCFIGFHSFPYIAQKTAAHFWQKAKNCKGHNGTEEKWFEVALTSDQTTDIWKGVVDQISKLAFQKGQISKNADEEEIITPTIPLYKISDAQTLFQLKDAYYNFISEQYGKKKNNKGHSFSFAELLRMSSQTSVTHWYTLVGYALATFSRKDNVAGLDIINQLKIFTKNAGISNNKQILEMGLLSYALLMYGKIEASTRFADNAYAAIVKRNQAEKIVSENSTHSEDHENDNDELYKIERDIHDLAEFCVGRIVLEARILNWKVMEELSLQNKDVVIPEVLDIKRLKPGVRRWLLYLRRLVNNEIFNGIAKTRRECLKQFHALTYIVGGLEEIEDSGFECDDRGKIEKRAAQAWQALKKS